METFIISALSVGLCILTSIIIFKAQKGKIQSLNLQLQHRVEMLQEEIIKVENKLEEAQRVKDEEVQLKFEAEKSRDVMNQRLREIQKRMDDWQEVKDKSIEHAKAAIFEVGGKLSSKLIEEHKRETEEARKESEKRFKETADKVNKDFQNIVNTVASLNDQVKESKNMADVVHRALLSPSGAGSLAEITLENILKSSGLQRKIDYEMQYSVGDIDNRLRPDAVVFLPSDNLMVIDSKASKFFLEVAENEEVAEKLKLSMRKHLKDLTMKDYKDAVQKHIKDLKKSKVKHVSTIMFLPSETALEKLQEYDSEFIYKAWEANIFPAGPIGLVNILSHAKFQISESRQAENYQIIVDEVENLMSGLATIFSHAKKLGTSIQGASFHFDKFAASFNTNILSKAKRLQKLGVSVKNNKELPNHLDRYQMISSKDMTLIEAESEEETKEIEQVE